jgi:hypothetical protein
LTVELNMEYKPGFYKKTGKKQYDKALKDAINKAILWSESESRKRAPVRTGNLRDHHSTRITEEKAELVNNCGYAGYVAFGTSKQRAQNYPLSIVKDIQSQKMIPNDIKESLKKEGVL